jgi:predicted glutamine amidotransferase
VSSGTISATHPYTFFYGNENAHHQFFVHNGIISAVKRYDVVHNSNRSLV